MNVNFCHCTGVQSRRCLQDYHLRLDFGLELTGNHNNAVVKNALEIFTSEIEDMEINNPNEVRNLIGTFIDKLDPKNVTLD